MTPHAYQDATATHTVQTPYGRLAVCRECYATCYRTYPGANVVSLKHDGRCQCEHETHFPTEGGTR